MRKSLRRFIKRIGEKKFRMGFAFIVCLPLMIWGFCNGGWSSMAAAVAGFLIGQLISKRLFG